MENQELDRKDLKILAYKEKLANLEEQNADLRVELTILSQLLAQQTEDTANVEQEEDSSVTADS